MPSAHLSRSRDEVPGTVLRRRVSIKNPVASGDILANATSHSHAGDGETHGHRCPMLPFLPAPGRLGGGRVGTTTTTSCATSIRWPKWLNGHAAHPCVRCRALNSVHTGGMFVFGRVIVSPESGLHSDRSDFT